MHCVHFSGTIYNTVNKGLNPGHRSFPEVGVLHELLYSVICIGSDKTLVVVRALCVDLPESGFADILDIGYIWIYCVDLAESRLAVLWILFLSGYNLWIYQRVDLLFTGCCLHPKVETFVGQSL